MIDLNLLGEIYRAPNATYDLDSKKFLNLSYSLYGEDLIIRSKMKEKFFTGKTGVYVDIGAFHPYYLSNTYLFYGAGWSGVCVDPNPIFKDSFQKVRPRDKFVNVAVLNEEKNLYFATHTRNTGMSNVFDSLESISSDYNKPQKIKSMKLSKILEESFEVNNLIDFMSIDTEGNDLEVLQSNNWSRFRPKLICIEEHDMPIAQLDTSPITVYLQKQGYRVFAHISPNIFFEEVVT